MYIKLMNLPIHTIHIWPLARTYPAPHQSYPTHQESTNRLILPALTSPTIPAISPYHPNTPKHPVSLPNTLTQPTDLPYQS